MKQIIATTSSNHIKFLLLHEVSCDYVWLMFMIQHLQETCGYLRQRWNQQPYMKTIMYCSIERMI